MQLPHEVRSEVRAIAGHDEMDGVGADARLIFVFTTNRPDVLERLEDADFARALQDMSGTGSKLTARLLGAEGFGFVTP